MGWIANFLLLQEVLPGGNAAYTFWSISIEYHIYLLLPLMLVLWRRINWPTAVGVASLIGLAGIAAAALLDSRLWQLYPSYYLLFALAAGACICVRRRPDVAARIPWRAIGAMCAAPQSQCCGSLAMRPR
ncbi:hypothetical protein GORHZ_244_00120 [Gordonia rhizosphera NBRC 16068]|uniref:Acyltransferase n=1 Tax=Gordonia rhizosphera NBRC 16068 TaxID=1108045 RepID=K6X4N7_9ACTN|nr:hypothetical protein GORHZ_244_00120 [Gordonia rhizosphera NBRC 16068]